MADQLDPTQVVPGTPTSGKGVPSHGPGSVVASDRLEAAEKAFKDLLRKQEADSAPAPTEASDPPAEKKKRAPKKEAPQKKATKAPEPAAAPEEEPKEEAAKAAPEVKPDPEMEKLRRKLRLSGVPRKAMESLSDDEVREWWEVVEERESAKALAHQRASDAEKELGSLKATKKPEPGVPTGGPDLDAIAKDLADQFGEDETGAFMKALTALIAPVQEELQGFKKMFGEARERTVEQIFKSNRDRLSKQLPYLSENDRAWKAIQEEVAEMLEDNPGKFTSPEDAFDEVFSDIYGGVLESRSKASEEDAEAEAVEEISASEMTPPSVKPKAKAAGPMDGAFAVWKHLQTDPDDVDGARRARTRALRA